MQFAIVAATVIVTWTHPSTYTDGSPLPLDLIKTTVVRWDVLSTGAEAGRIRVDAPATSIKLNVPDKTALCFTLNTETKAGQVSEDSQTRCNELPSQPDAPVIIDLRSL